jgi:hypothetical protein
MLIEETMHLCRCNYFILFYYFFPQKSQRELLGVVRAKTYVCEFVNDPNKTATIYEHLISTY